jgi:DNA adenine methylase
LLPFLRWAGGKRKLADLITNCFPQEFWNSNNKFFEPFVGGGAVMLHLGDRDQGNFIPGSRLSINDMNPDLICTYEAIQNNVEDLILELKNLSKDLSKDKYLEIRAQHDLEGFPRAARFIYLNKTGFNGLWRVNAKGQYNVPWGQLKNPTIFDANQLRQVSERLNGAEITHLNFSNAVSQTESGDVVYFDPPYIPLSNTASFSQYAMADFGIAEQKELAKTIEGLNSKSVNVVLSNSDTELSREIFGKVLNLYQIDASRAIAAKAASRGSVKEIIGLTHLIPEKILPETMKLISAC